jgi:hypothetical protein
MTKQKTKEMTLINVFIPSGQGKRGKKPAPRLARIPKHHILGTSGLINMN